MIYFNMTMEQAHSLLLSPMEMGSMDTIQDLTRQIISMLLIRTYHTMIVVHQTKEQERQTKVQAKRIAIQICHPRKYPLKQIRTRINLVRKRNKRDWVHLHQFLCTTLSLLKMLTRALINTIILWRRESMETIILLWNNLWLGVARILNSELLEARNLLLEMDTQQM